MLGLQVTGVVWSAGGQFELNQDQVYVRRGTAAVVLAEPDAGTGLADALTGLSRPVQGEIVVDDVVVTDLLPAPHQIALVPLGAGLLPHLTVTKNIEFNLRRTSSRAARAAQVRELARQFELDGALRVRPHRLSAEQRLRVACARAVAGPPGAVVVEDRHDQVDCAAAVRAVIGQNIAVVVITDTAERAHAISSRVYAARPVPAPEPSPDQEVADAGQRTEATS